MVSLFRRALFGLSLVLAVGNLTGQEVQTFPGYGHGAFGPGSGLLFSAWMTGPHQLALQNNSVWSTEGPSSVSVYVDGVQQSDWGWTGSAGGTVRYYTVAGPSSAGVGVSFAGSVTCYWTGEPGPTEYNLTFIIPANTGTTTTHFYTEQDGVILGQYSQEPGAAATSVTQTSESDSDITLKQITGGYVGDNGSGAPTIIGDTISTTIGSGTPSTGGSTVTGVSPPSSTPANSTPATPPPPDHTPGSGPGSVTPGGSVTGPSTPDVPNPSPTDENGAKTKDIEKQTNQLVDQLHKNSLQVVNSANGVIDAVNEAAEAVHDSGSAVVGAVNKVGTTVGEGLKSLFDVVNAQKGQNEKIVAELELSRAQAKKGDDIANGLLASIKSNTENAANTLGDLKQHFDERDPTTAEEKEDAAAVATAGSTAAGATAAGVAQGVIDGAKFNGGPITHPTGSAPQMKIQMPSAFGGQEIDFNPFTGERLGPIAEWFRAACTWLLLIYFGYFCWEHMTQTLVNLGQIPQAVGNPVVAGTGAQGTAFVAAVAISSFIATAAVALVSFAFGELTFPAIVSAMAQSPVTTMPSGVLWMVNQLIPVATTLSVLVGRLVYKQYTLALYTFTSTLIRHVVP